MPGATPLYGWPYPIGTDPLDDAVSTIPEDLALAMESTLSAWSGVSAPTAWTAPSLVAPWASLGAPIALARYRKVGNEVWLRGTITNSSAVAAGADIMTLPVGFRPSSVSPAGSVIFACAASVGYARVDITSAGLVEIQTGLGASGFLSLDGIRFMID